MKSKDLLLIGGIGLLAFTLFKPKAASDVEQGGGGGGGTTVIPFSGGSAFGGGIEELIDGLLNRIPPQVIPDLNIPEFTFPDIVMPELPEWNNVLPDWENFFPDWEKFLPNIPDELDFPSLPELPDIPSLFDSDGKDSGAFMGFIAEAVKGWDNFWNSSTRVLQWGNRPISTIFESLETTERKAALRAETEADWQARGLPEYVTPDWLYRRNAEMSMPFADLLALREANSGSSSESNTTNEESLPYAEWDSDIALLEKHPYFSTVI